MLIESTQLTELRELINLRGLKDLSMKMVPEISDHDTLQILSSTNIHLRPNKK